MWRRLAKILKQRCTTDEFDRQSEIDEELLFHIQMRTDQLVRTGMTPDKALDFAQTSFGDFQQVRMACLAVREQDPILLRVRQGSRVLSLSTTIGLFLAVLIVALGVFVVRPTQFQDRGEWVLFGMENRATGAFGAGASYEDFERYRNDSRYVDVTIARYVTATLTGSGRPEIVTVKEVSPNYFEAFDAIPIGDDFSGTACRGDTTRSAARPVVLSRRLWASRFAADRSAIGSAILIDGSAHVVCGIAPADFTMYMETDVFRPIDAVAAAEIDGLPFLVAARLGPGQSLTAENHRLAAMAGESRSVRPAVRTIQKIYSRPVSAGVWLFVLGGVAGALVLALHNIRRLHDIQVIEVAISGIVAVVVAVAIVDIIRPVVLASYDHLFNLKPVLLYLTVAIAACVGMLFAVSAAPGKRRVKHQQGDHPESPDTGRARKLIETLLIAGQLAVSLVLLCVTIKAIAVQVSIERNANRESRSTYVSKFHFGATAETPQDRLAVLGRLADKLDGESTLETVSLSSSIPGDPDAAERSLATAVGSDTRRIANVQINRVGTDYLNAMEVRLLDGSSFAEVEPGERVAGVVVSRALADRLWPDGDATGKRLILDRFESSFTVIGVAEDRVASSSLLADEPTAYLWFWRYWVPSPYFVFKSHLQPRLIRNVVESVVDQTDPNIAMSALRPVGAEVAFKTRYHRRQMLLLAFLALLAMASTTSSIRRVTRTHTAVVQQRTSLKRQTAWSLAQIAAPAAATNLGIFALGTALGAALALALSRVGPGPVPAMVSPTPGIVGLTILAALVVCVGAGISPIAKALHRHPHAVVRRP